jgi:MFS family permease
MTAEPTGRRGWLWSGDFGRFWLARPSPTWAAPSPSSRCRCWCSRLTGSPLSLGLTAAFEFVPYLLFGLVIGAWVDRVDRRRLMIATDLARAAVIAVIPVLAAVGVLSVGWVYAVAFCSATLTIAFDAGQFAAIPSLVPSSDDLVSANGQVQASYSAAQIAGPLLAGALITVVPVHQLLWVDAASFLLSAGMLALIATTFNTPGTPRGAARSAARSPTGCAMSSGTRCCGTSRP